MHEGEALTLATSLFPDKPRENTFFVEGPRKIFAYLLTLKPAPEELVWWMSHEDELDRRLQGTELATFIYRGAGPHRARQHCVLHPAIYCAVHHADAVAIEPGDLYRLEWMG